jgi:hypothetical protein
LILKQANSSFLGNRNIFPSYSQYQQKHYIHVSRENRVLFDKEKHFKANDTPHFLYDGSKKNEKKHEMKMGYVIKNKGSENESFSIILNLYCPLYQYQYYVNTPKYLQIWRSAYCFETKMRLS